MVNVGINIPYMDPMGIYKKRVCKCNPSAVFAKNQAEITAWPTPTEAENRPWKVRR